jgi:hypothetical protein
MDGNRGVSARDPMTDHSYTFDASPERRRRLGARGGRAFGRNQRARRTLLATRREVVPLPAVLQATVSESIAILDARFPWLRGAEKRLSGNQPPRPQPMRARPGRT